MPDVSTGDVFASPVNFTKTLFVVIGVLICRFGGREFIFLGGGNLSFWGEEPGSPKWCGPISQLRLFERMANCVTSNQGTHVSAAS